MNKMVSAGILSLGISLASQTSQASEFGGALLGGGLFDAITESKTKQHEPQKTEVLKVSDTQKQPQKKKVSQAKAKVNYQVAQIVGDTYISTTMSEMKKHASYDCREKGKYRYYFSETKDTIGSDIFSILTQKQVKKILTLPKCKK